MRGVRQGFVLFLVALLAAGCSTAGAGHGQNRTQPPQDTGQLVVHPRDGELSAEIAHWAEALRPVEGVYVRREGDYQYVLVAMGERPTGGYQVVLNGVTEAEDHVLLEVAYRAPGAGDLVTQALTYPYLLVAVRSGKAIRAQLADGVGAATPLLIHEHDTAGQTDLIVVDAPVPFQGVGGTIRLAGRVRTALPVHACVEDGHHVLLEATQLELAAAGDGWRAFDQEFTLRGASNPYGMLAIWFGDGAGRVETIVPLRLVDWSYANK